MKKYEMELVDWKNIERNMSETIRAAHVNISLNEIVLSRAVREIKRLGGKTLEEEEAEVKSSVIEG